MKSRTVQVLLIVALLAPFTGCPGSTAIRLGEWVFEVDEDGSLYPVVLHANGTTSIPSGVAVFFGNLTWSQQGSVFVLNQQIDNDIWVYTSTSLSRTSMAGVITGPNAGTWTANFVK